MLGSLFISGHDWLLPAGGILLLAIGLLAWTYLSAPASPGLRGSLRFLEALGFAALAAILLEPLWSAQRARPGANYFAVVADNSQGMQIKDKGETKSRGEQLHGAASR